MKDVSSQQIGSAMRRLAEDLVAARRRVMLLERENRQLRQQLQALERANNAPEPGSDAETSASCAS